MGRSRETLALVVDLHRRLADTERMYVRVNDNYVEACRSVAALKAENERLNRELMLARGDRPNGGGADA